MSWLNRRPEVAIARAEPGDLLAELRAATQLTPEAEHTLDAILRAWTLQALARAGDVEGLLDLDDLCGLAIRVLSERNESAEYRTRWRAFRDLLESKRLAVGGRESGRAWNLLHCQPIRDLLAKGEMPQSRLQEELGLSPQRLSQVLGVMEEGGLIQREKRGKEKLVSLGQTDEGRLAIARTAPVKWRLGCVLTGRRSA